MEDANNNSQGAGGLPPPRPVWPTAAGVVVVGEHSEEVEEVLQHAEDAEAEAWIREDEAERAEPEYDWREDYVTTHEVGLQRLADLLVNANQPPFDQSTFTRGEDVVEWVLAMHEHEYDTDADTDTDDDDEDEQAAVGPGDAAAMAAAPFSEQPQEEEDEEQDGGGMRRRRPPKRKCAELEPGFYAQVENRYSNEFLAAATANLPRVGGGDNNDNDEETTEQEDTTGAGSDEEAEEEEDADYVDSPRETTTSNNNNPDDEAAASSSSDDDDDDDESGSGHNDDDESPPDPGILPDDLEVIGQMYGRTGGQCFEAEHPGAAALLLAQLAASGGPPVATCLDGVTVDDLAQALYDAQQL